MADCIDKAALIENHIDKVLTQYRESPHLLGLIRNLLGQAAEVMDFICKIPDYFDLDTAVGEQLTILGKELGWPRCHCVCVTETVFGFECAGSTGGVDVVGFCEGGTWINCESIGSGEYCLSDDETYRKFLKARRFQLLKLYDIQSLQTALREIWGDTAMVASTTVGKIIVSPGRALSASETTELPLVIRVLPVAPGIEVGVHLLPGPIFGFGDGWAGLCEGANWMCDIDPHAYDCV